MRKSSIFKLGKSSIVKYVSVKQLEALNIPLPPLHTQHRLVQELQTIDTNIQTIEECIKCDEQRIRDLQQLKKDAIASMCCVTE